jgi:hypothetical protein
MKLQWYDCIVNDKRQAVYLKGDVDEYVASLKAENEAYERFADDVGRANVLASTYGYLARNISEAQQRLAHALLKERE